MQPQSEKRFLCQMYGRRDHVDIPEANHTIHIRHNHSVEVYFRPITYRIERISALPDERDCLGHD